MHAEVRGIEQVSFYSLRYSLEIGFPTEPLWLAVSARMAVQRVPRIRLTRPIHCWGYKYMQPCLLFVLI